MFLKNQLNNNSRTQQPKVLKIMVRKRFSLQTISAMRIFSFLLMCALLVTGSLFYYLRDESVSTYVKIYDYKIDSGKSVKHVLFWTTFFSEKFWSMKNETYGEDYLKSINCPKTNCIFTHKKDFLDQPHEYDAIFFHGVEDWSFNTLPPTRSLHQLYIMVSKE